MRKQNAMATKEKKSFFEKLTGAQQVGEEREPLPIYEEEEERSARFSLRPDEEDEQPSWVAPTLQPRANTQSVPVQPESDGEGQLTIDVYQTESEIVIKSTIAGVKPEDLDVSINNDMVTVKGERKNEEIVENGNYYYQECYWGGFSRSVLLPVDVIPEKADASLKNGILTIRLPKADTNKVRRIQVRGF